MQGFWEDNVFIGHNVAFINDPYPRAAIPGGNLQTDEDWVCVPTIVKQGASIGSGTVILCGITIGSNAIVGSGSVVTKNVEPYTIVAGSPAKLLRRVHDKDSIS